MMTRTRFVVAVIVLAASGAAQLQFDQLGSRFPPGTDISACSALGDVNFDGYLDVVIGNLGRRRNRLHVNDGTGRFTDVTSTHMPIDSDTSKAVALADLDGDADLDLVFANHGTRNRLYLNDGTGVFVDSTQGRMPMDNNESLAVAVGDVDGDSDNDIVFGNRGPIGSVGNQNRIYINDGSGTFTDMTATHLPVDSDLSDEMLMADLDADGDLDVVFGNNGPAQDRLYLNDGTGVFVDVTATHMPAAINYTNGIAVGDLDGDGDPDLVLTGSGERRVYLNDGTATFTAASGRIAGSARSRTLALGDVDGDGDLDLVVGTDAANELHLNDGAGMFTDVTAARLAAGQLTEAVSLGDLDRDGDLDLVFANAFQNGQNEVHLNLLRQLDAPLRPRIGQTYSLDAYARYGPPSAAIVALPFVSPATATVVLPPLGTVGIDPMQAVALPPFFVPRSVGVSSVSISVPNSPGLVGASVYAQVLLVPYPLQARLTNFTADVIGQ